VDDFRKAAILLQHLDPESRNQILARLPESQQAQIASLLNSPVEVGADELTEIVREYQSQFQQAQTVPVAAAAEDKKPESIEHESDFHESTADEYELDSLAGSIQSLFSPPQLAELLAPESDSILSAIIAHLPQAEGRDLFVRLEETRQTTLAECLADQEEIAPAITDEINEFLAEKHRIFANSKKKGLSVLSGLLTSSGHPTNGIIVDKLRERDRQILARIRQDADSSPG